MRDWRSTLSALATIRRAAAPFPLSVFEARPPTSAPWPQTLPACPEAEAFYRICDGGYLGQFNIPRLSELGAENQRWASLLRDWGPEGSVLDPTRHLVIATDSGGCPVVLDILTDEVRAFQFDGGSWETPLAQGFASFMQWLFNTEAVPDDLWIEALDQLDLTHGAA